MSIPLFHRNFICTSNKENLKLTNKNSCLVSIETEVHHGSVNRCRTDTNMVENYNKVPIPYLQSIQPGGTKTLKPKSWLERLQQYTDRVDETNIEPTITGKQITKQKYKAEESKTEKDFL